MRTCARCGPALRLARSALADDARNYSITLITAQSDHFDNPHDSRRPILVLK